MPQLDHNTQTIDLQLADWRVVDDVVMGGRSASNIEILYDGLRFHGELSLENGGGFASIRAALENPVHDWAAFLLDVTGDGREYQFRLRENEDPSAAAWRATFRTNGERQTIRLPREEFIPVIRGRRVEIPSRASLPAFRYFGFMLTSREAGPFQLTVHCVERVLEPETI